MTVLRWILFLPASFVGGVLASSLLRMGAFIFPEIIRLLVCGAGGAAGMVCCGLYVAPRKTQAVKWILIVLAALLGLLSGLGSLLAGEDKLEAAIGISMLLTALAFSGVKPEEITRTAQPEN
ncbi:MAG TPA: hypothetical protein PKE12_14445 [Kiritimatiellia bacterium]|nr:hypothetical protein [Kiritimatiellia bacterium]